MASLQGYPQLQARLKAIGSGQAGEQVMKTLGMAVVREAKLLVPRKTGNLGRSIHLQSVSPTSATVAASANYAGFVEFGTRPHEITPKARKALRWAATSAGRRLSGSPRTGAAVVFATRVHHPGTRPNPFLLSGAKLAASRAGIADVIVKEWNQAG